MRTTVTFDDDVAAAIRQLRQTRGMGVSEAANHLARQGLTLRPESRPFRLTTSRIGIKIDVSNVAEALDALDGPASR